jgi:dethiobiotin synthetase
MANNGTIFITGTGTGAGKTVVTCLLARALRASGKRVAAVKPLCSGPRSDARRLCDAGGGGLTLDEVNPWWFRAPLTPLVAARQEGRSVRLRELVEHVRAVRERFEWVLVEGAGGLLSPLGEGFDARNLILRLRAQAVVTGVNQLGVINQVLLTLQCLPARFSAAARIVLVAAPRPNTSSESNIALLRERLGPHRVKVLRRMTAAERAGDAMKRAELDEWVRWLAEVA